MKAYRRKGKIDQEWQEFLNKTNGSMRISHHCLLRVAKRFPEMLKLTQNEFLDLVKNSKPICVFYMPTKQNRGIILRNGNIGFALSFETGKVMTTFPYKPGRTKQATLNLKGEPREKKTVYHRPKAKQKTRQQILEET